MSTQQSSPLIADAPGSIVERAIAILQRQGRQQSSFPKTEQSPSWDQPLMEGKPGGALPLPSNLQQCIKLVEEELVRLVETATQPTTRIADSSVDRSQLPVAPQASLAKVHNEGRPPGLRVAVGAPGSPTWTALSIVNDTSAPSAVVLRCTSLVNDWGDEIPSRFVSFLPARLRVAAGCQEPVQVAVSIPSNTAPGLYSGLVLAAGPEDVQAVVRVAVEANK